MARRPKFWNVVAWLLALAVVPAQVASDERLCRDVAVFTALTRQMPSSTADAVVRAEQRQVLRQLRNRLTAESLNDRLPADLLAGFRGLVSTWSREAASAYPVLDLSPEDRVVLEHLASICGPDLEALGPHGSRSAEAARGFAGQSDGPRERGTLSRRRGPARAVPASPKSVSLAVGSATAILVFFAGLTFMVVGSNWFANRERRRAVRYDVWLEADLVVGGSHLAVMVLDVGQGGCKLGLSGGLEPGARCHLSLLGTEIGARVAWSNAHYSGLRFLHALTRQQVAAMVDAHHDEQRRRASVGHSLYG